MGGKGRVVRVNTSFVRRLVVRRERLSLYVRVVNEQLEFLRRGQVGVLPFCNAQLSNGSSPEAAAKMQVEEKHTQDYEEMTL